MTETHKTYRLREAAELIGASRNFGPAETSKLYRALRWRATCQIIPNETTRGKRVEYSIEDVLFMKLTCVMGDMGMGNNRMRGIRDYLFSNSGDPNRVRIIDKVIEQIKSGNIQTVLIICSYGEDVRFEIIRSIRFETIGKAMTIGLYLNEVFRDLV